MPRWLRIILVLPLVVPLFPLLLLVGAAQLVTPPEWWHNIHGDNKIARKVNYILWLQLRLGDWY